MIASFGDLSTSDLFHGVRSRRVRSFPPEIIAPAARKLDLLEAAETLEDLRAIPGNRLEVLRGDLAGRFSVRVNRRWRIVFRWHRGNAHEIRLIDYHGG